jgi:geranylgeranyl pyrophosphate synthase
MDIDIKEILKEKKPVIDKVIKKYVPKKYTEEDIIFTLGPPSYKYNVEAPTKFLSEPVWEFLDRGGKRWRPVLFLLVAEALGGDPDKYIDLVVFPELIHNGSIIVDDIEDMSEERRGRPVLHKLFGLDIALNAGNILYYLALLPLIKNKDKFDSKTLNRLYEVYTQEMLRIGFGQGTDIAWHNSLANADNVSEEEYLEMCSNKTGCIARLSTKVGAIVAGSSDEEAKKVGKFAETVGIAFQIQDDILNVSESELSKKKGGKGEDITEGKRSLMIIHTLQNASKEDRERLLEILKMHTTDQKIRDEAISIMKKYGSIEYSKKKAKKMVEESWDEMKKILPESNAKKKLKAFAYYLIERDI